MPNSETPPKEKLGLIAAWGEYPAIIARSMREQGHEVHCLAVRRHAEESLRESVDQFQWVSAAKLGQAIRYLKKHNIKTAVMAGKFHKVDLYRPWAWFRYFPDAEFIKHFAWIFLGTQADQKDDTIMGRYIDAFAQHGITIVPPTNYQTSLLVKEGIVSGNPLTASEEADAWFGWKLAREMGRLDVGQSVCVKDRAILAVEAIEGTDLCIQRAGELCKSSGFTVVKVAKPSQDMRFDVPTVGIKTLENIYNAGGRTLIIEADRTIVLEQSDFSYKAKQLGIKVVALSDQHQTADQAA